MKTTKGRNLFQVIILFIIKKNTEIKFRHNTNQIEQFIKYSKCCCCCCCCFLSYDMLYSFSKNVYSCMCSYMYMCKNIIIIIKLREKRKAHILSALSSFFLEKANKRIQRVDIVHILSSLSNIHTLNKVQIVCMGFVYLLQNQVWIFFSLCKILCRLFCERVSLEYYIRVVAVFFFKYNSYQVFFLFSCVYFYLVHSYEKKYLWIVHKKLFLIFLICCV